jgi:alkaline phosphatase D
MRTVIIALILLSATTLSFGQSRFNNDRLLQAGPMVGYVEMREALLWVQTSASATVRFEYFDTQNPTQVFRTNEFQTQESEAFTARLIADQVEPGRTYGYRLYLNGREVFLRHTLKFKTPDNWRFRTTPPLLRFTFGSGNFVNDERYDREGIPYGGDYEIFNRILEKEPDMMLWLGDNLFFRESDWYSRTGIMYRYSQMRSRPELQPLLGGTAHYAIWDDHDFGPNDSDRTFREKKTSLEAFKHFWGNPSYGVNEQPGITTTFERDDCQFFLMDNRYFRTPNGIKSQAPTILGKQQLDWLVEALVSSTATFKFVCIGGQVLTGVDKFESYYHIAPEERQYLLDAIVRNKVKNVIFLTGDAHSSELSVYSKEGVRMYDFTSSPLTAKAYQPEPGNGFLVRGTGYGQRSFGMIEVYGLEGKRRARLMLFDKNGKQVWMEQIEAQF